MTDPNGVRQLELFYSRTGKSSTALVEGPTKRRYAITTTGTAGQVIGVEALL